MKRIIIVIWLLILGTLLVTAETREQNYLQLLEKKLAAAQAAGNKSKIATIRVMIAETQSRIETAKSGEITKIKDDLAAYKKELNANYEKLQTQLAKVEGEDKALQLSGQLFFRWQKYTQNGGSNVNNFDLDRAYLNFNKKLNWDASARITLDIARLDTSKFDTSKKNQNLFDYLKYAYVDMPVSAAANLLSPLSLSARLGLQQTVWVDWADKILNLRFIAKSLVDNEGVMTSADFGIGALGKVSLANLPEIEYQVALLNGSSYKSPETDSQKNIGMRLNSTIYQNETMGSVIIGGFGNLAGVSASGTDSNTAKQAGALVAYKHDLGTAYLEYLYGTGISGFSLGGLYNFYSGFNIFARVDHFDPNRSITNDELDRLFFGIIYNWGKDIRLALDLQSVTGGTAASTSAGKTTSALYLHTLTIF